MSPSPIAEPAMEALSHAVVVLSAEGAVRYANPAALALLDLGVDQILGRGVEEAISPDAVEGFERSKAIEGWAGDIQMPDGNRLAARWSPLPDGGGVVVLARPGGETEDRTRQQLELALEASQMGVWDWDIHTNEVRWSRPLEVIYGLPPGGAPRNLEALATLLHPDDRDEVLAQIQKALQERGPHHVIHRVIWPDGTVRWVESKGRVLLGPDGRPTGMTGVAVDISDHKRAEFLAEAGEILSGSLEVEEIMSNLASLTVPRFAEWCVVFVENDEHPRRAVAVHADPAQAALVDALLDRYAPDPDSTLGPPHVLRTGLAELYPEIPAELLELLAPNPHDLRVLREMELSSAMIVPLTARNQTFGTVAVFSNRPELHYGEQDLTFVVDLAQRAALAIDNANLYQEQHEISHVLQRSLIPPRLPQLRGIELAAAYRPGGRTTEVGGDFYDCFRAADGDWGLVVGDVCGRGVEAASLTALARHTLRASAGFTRSPSEDLCHLNRAIIEVLEEQGSDRFFTAAEARLRQTSGGEVEAILACAGHPPPLLVRTDGTVREVGRSGLLLGIVADLDLEDERVELKRGDVLVLYTDGVVEAHGQTAEPFGEERLHRVLSEAAGQPAEAIVSRLLRAVRAFERPGETGDDIAILVIRVTGSPV